jgi:YVTN family beta-propeller protein
MSFRNKGWMAATVLAVMICVACGQIYRPVVIPINNIPPSPADFHAVFSLNTNAFYGLDQNPANPSIPPLIPTLLYGPGSAMQIDVGGDTDLGIASLVDGTVSGANPTHGVSLPNFSRVFVASAGSAIADGLDAISSFVPVTQSATSSGIGAATVVSYPNLIPNPGALPPAQPNFFCSYLPDFVAASQNTTVYVANYGVENAPPVCNPNGTTSTDSITVVNGTSNVITNIVYAAPASTPPIVLSNPVALAQVQTLNGNKLYVANQGNNTVASFYTVDMAPTTATGTVSGFSGTTPVWIVARGDGQQVYVVSQGDGQLWTIDAATDAVIGSVSVGVGANYVLYDPNLNRLYVTNPNNSSAYIFSVAGSLPSLLSACGIPTPGPTVSTCLPAGYASANYPSCVNPCPTSVAALPDGTEAYIASYQLVPASEVQVPPPPPNPVCTDPNFTTPTSPTSAPACYVAASVTVLDALSMAMTSQVSALAAPSGEIAVAPEVANCLPANTSGLYTPGLVPVSPTPPSGAVSRFAARFRVSAVAAADSSRVYVSVCDAGSVAIINTTDSNINNPGSNIPDDTLLLDLATPFGIGTTSNSLPQQNPVLLFPGQ